MNLLECSFCRKNKAFYVRSYEGIGLCHRCFKKNIEDRVRRTISKYKMLKPNDHVAVAVSGGKDSLSLLTILGKITKRFPKSRLTAVTVDEGITGYRDEAITIAKNHYKNRSINYAIVSFEDLFQIKLDQLVKEKRELSPCSYCGVLRRRAINLAAEKVGANVVATAHNLDDEVQTAMLNIVHGDVTRISRVEPVLEDPNRRFLRRVKPICEIPEKEVAMYAYESGIEFQKVPCPYMATSLRNDMRSMLNRMEVKHPGTKYTIFRSTEKLRSALKQYGGKTELKNCRYCGEPTTTDTCQVCKILKKAIP
jgi:uncharacterized protein (TIGR00269 family)